MSLLKTNEIQNYNGSSLTLTASTVSTSAQLNTGGNISVTGSLNVSDDSTTRTNLGLGTIATQDSSNVSISGGSITGTTIVPSTPFSFRNRIINGNLSNPINQRSAGSITASTGYTYDRWYYDGSTYLYQGIENKNVNNGTYVISWEGSGINAAWKVSTDTTANNGPDSTTGFTSVSNGGTFTVNEGTEYSKHLWIRFDGTLANLDKVMVEEGTVATPFEHRPYGTELVLCQRYFETSYNIGTAIGTATDVGSCMFISNRNPGLPHTQVRYAVTKRTTPTFTAYNPNDGTSGEMRDLDASADYSVQFTRNGYTGGTLWTYTSVGLGNLLQFHYTASAEI